MEPIVFCDFTRGGTGKTISVRVDCVAYLQDVGPSGTMLGLRGGDTEVWVIESRDEVLDRMAAMRRLAEEAQS